MAMRQQTARMKFKIYYFATAVRAAVPGRDAQPQRPRRRFLYRLYGAPARLGLLDHHRGHAVQADVAPRRLEWMETYV